MFTINGLLTIQEGSAKTFGHGDEIVIRDLGSVQVDHTIVEIDGLTRCTWKGRVHFKSFVWSSVVAHNLALLARLKPA